MAAPAPPPAPRIHHRIHHQTNTPRGPWARHVHHWRRIVQARALPFRAGSDHTRRTYRKRAEGMAADTIAHHGDPAPAGIDTLCIDTIRTLSMDGVQKAKSGHPGTPMAMAPVAYTLWQTVLRYDPAQPRWPNRDRFVLSIGHASMLLYSLLHLANVRRTGADGAPAEAVSLDDLKQFRQLGSLTPGHPEYGHTVGVETTTGPLGQGVANSVGMAMAERWFAARYNRPGFPLFDYRVYALCGDGDMMEGVSSEAASMAAHLKLSNLVWIYDSNHITIEGSPSRRPWPKRNRSPTARPSSRCTASSAMARQRSRAPAKPTANRWAMRSARPPSASTAGRKTRNSWCRTACRRISPTAWAPAAPA
jgi:transketolase N-terminal domain/subunit